MSAFVPLFKHRRDAAFPMLAPMTMLVVTFPASVHHSTEEDHLHEAEEEE